MTKLLLGTAALLLAGTAQAVTITSAPFDAALAPGEQLVVTFDAPNAPGFTLTGTGGIYQGSTPGIAAAPANNATKYLAVLNGKQAVLDTPNLGSFSMYLGSVDAYNSITFKGVGGYSETVSGAQLIAAAYGNQSSGQSNRRFYFDFGSERVNQVIFNSTGNSFEFDNIAANVVPEPATWAMLITGFGFVGFAMRRRRGAVATVSA